MNTYEEYKESGIEWIGKIPKHWQVKKLKKLINSLESGNREKGGGNQLDEGIFSLGGEHINWDGSFELKNNKFISEEYFESLNKGKILEKDVLLVKDGATIGKTAIVRNMFFEKMAVNEHVFILRAINSPIYLYYLISGDIGFTQIRNQMRGSAQEGLNSKFINCCLFPSPNNEEQIQIADFLDDKTFKINKIIKNKKKQIDILLEKLKIKIKDILNKGLTETDTFNCEIKWIESYPKHWKINKIQNTTYVKGRIGWQGLTSEEYLDSGEYYLITGTDFKEGKINWDSCHYIEKERYDEDPYIQLKEEDVLITKDGTIGKIAYVTNIPKPTTLNTGVFVTRPLNKKYLQRYMFWILNSHLFDSYIEYIKSGSTISHLYQNKFVRFYFPIPPKEEQEQIVNYLDTYSSNIQKAIKVIQTEIDKLEEYKKILIHDVVTGKMRVTI